MTSDQGQNQTGQNGKRTWTEDIEIAANELVDRVKELIKEGNVRRLIIKSPNDNVLLEVPLTAGVAVGAAATIINPVLAALGAFAALLVKVKIEVVRVDDGPDDSDDHPTA
jgi:hypothetical protein